MAEAKDAGSAWTKIAGMFGSDGELADSTEAFGIVDTTADGPADAGIPDLKAGTADADWLVL